MQKKKRCIIHARSVVYAKDLNEFIHLLLAEPNATWENNLYPLNENTKIWVNEKIRVLETTDLGEWDIWNPPKVIEDPCLSHGENASISENRAVFAVNTLLDGEKRYEFMGMYALEKSSAPSVHIWKRYAFEFLIENFSSLGHVGNVNVYSDVYEKVIFRPHLLTSKEEVVTALKKLKGSEGTPLPYTKRSNSCILQEPISTLVRNYICNNCGQSFSLEQPSTRWLWFPGNEEVEYKEYRIDPLKKYNGIVKKFCSLGFSASISCLCADCADHLHPTQKDQDVHHFVFTFQVNTKSPKWFSYPNTKRFDKYDYDLALVFLNGADTYEKFAAKGFSAYSRFFYRVNNILS